LRVDSITYEIMGEPDYEIYVSACPVLDPFQKYLEISVVFGLSICTATTNTSTVGNGNMLLGFCVCVCVCGGGLNSNKKVGLRVIAEKLKICSFLHVEENPYPQDVS